MEREILKKEDDEDYKAYLEILEQRQFIIRKM